MYPLNEYKTAFITGRGIFCYKVIPFKLKNARATFERMVDCVVKDQIGYTMEVYVNNMLVKSVQHSDHLRHLGEVFDLLSEVPSEGEPEEMHLRSGLRKVPGISDHSTGIETNANQISVILDMKSQTRIKEIQILNGRIAALNRFLSHSTDKCKSFFEALKKKEVDFRWDECEVASKD